jgi:hypothetical protein
VQLGAAVGGRFEVLGGLEEGDRVLMHPPDSVKDDTVVQERAVP